MATPEKEEWIERLKKELHSYSIGEYDLDRVFEPLLDACARLTKTYDEFKQCVNESLTTLKTVMRKVRF